MENLWKRGKINKFAHKQPSSAGTLHQGKGGIGKRSHKRPLWDTNLHFVSSSDK